MKCKGKTERIDTALDGIMADAPSARTPIILLFLKNFPAGSGLTTPNRPTTILDGAALSGTTSDVQPLDLASLANVPISDPAVAERPRLGREPS